MKISTMTSIGRCVRAAVLVLASGLMLAGTVAYAITPGAVFSAPDPGSGSVVLTRPPWLSVVADDSSPIIAAAMSLNGVPVVVGIEYPNGHFVYDAEAESDIWVTDDFTMVRLRSYSPGARVVSGVNTVIASVTSASGTSTFAWAFTYGTATTVSAVTPAPAAVLAASPPVIVAQLTSPATSFVSTMTVDGNVVSTTFSAGTKSFTHTPSTALAAGVHAVVFSARDPQGGLATKTWTFKVSPPMSNGWDCTMCHTTYPAAHPISGCEDCHDHAYAPAGRHGGQIPTVAGCTGEATQQANTCHRLDHSSDTQFGVWGSGPFKCADCHSADHPLVPRHFEAAVLTADLRTQTYGCFGGSCHTKNLVAEHSKYPATAAIKYQCDLCHSATAPQRVRDAVVSQDMSCPACHERFHEE